MNIQGLIDEYQSERCAIEAISIALQQESSEFARAALSRSLRETLEAMVVTSHQLIDALNILMEKLDGEKNLH